MQAYCIYFLNLRDDKLHRYTSNPILLCYLLIAHYMGRERSLVWGPLLQPHNLHLPHFWNCNWLEDLKRRRAQKRTNLIAVPRIYQIFQSYSGHLTVQCDFFSHVVVAQVSGNFFFLSENKTPQSLLLPFYWLLETIAAFRFARRNTTGLVKSKPRLLL